MKSSGRPQLRGTCFHGPIVTQTKMISALELQPLEMRLMLQYVSKKVSKSLTATFEDMVFDELDEDDDDEDDLAVTVPIEPPCRSSKSTATQERQLSKKEMKKIELEKLEAVFAEFGVEVGVCTEAGKETDLGESKAAARRRKKAARVVSSSEQISEKKTANPDDAPGTSDTVLINPVEAKKLVAAKLTGKKKTMV